MRKIEHLQHTADLCIRVEGDSLEELFKAGAEGMNEILKPGFCNGSNNDISKKIDVESSDTTTLLIDFLSELLTLTYLEKAIFCKLDIEKLSDNSISAKAHGRKADGFDEDIKAVTFHDADIGKNEAGNFETLIVFDI